MQTGGLAGLSPVHMVSAFLTEAGFTLGSERVDDKSNEIKAIPILVRSLDLRGATVSSDAMGCQREIAACLREAGAHYLLQVKGNQPTLLAQIQDIAEERAGLRSGYERASVPATRYDYDRVSVALVALLRGPRAGVEGTQGTDVATRRA